jgi:gliding motility-associated-like protein
MIKTLLLNILAILISVSALSEGTKELRPTATSNGSLLLMPSYSMFAIYGASVKQQLKIRITSVNETIYFGLNNKNGIDAFGVSNDNGTFVPNIPFRIVSPSGLIVFQSVIPGTGVQGNIPTWAQAVAGPQQLGNATGYNALQVSPLETGDYILEFDPASKGITRLDLPLFDVTVAANGVAILGRLHSQGWQISTGSYTNPFLGVVYPYDGGTAVYKVDFNGMQPWVFVINFNSTGTGNTGNFLLDRQSKIGNYGYGEYEVFLNPPDETLYPTHLPALTLTGTVVKKDCVSSDFCLDFTVNSPGDLAGFIDLNNNGVYDPGLGEIYFEDRLTAPGTTCIPWNGRDSYGNLVTGNFQVLAALGFGITHLPLYDVEHNVNGYKVNIVRPAGSTPPYIFWDDSQITAGSALDAKVNLTGCLSAVSGCHRWINRGSINDPTALDQQETINTWWYSTIATTTELVSIPHEQKVKLSFDPVNLVQRDTTVCRGDSLSFYIYNDGTHFDLSKYNYEWTFNGNPLPPNVRQQRQKIMLDYSTVIIKSIDKTSLNCVAYDTLHILVVDPVTLVSQVTQPTCNTSTGSINVQLLTGPPNKQFYWTEFPGLNSGSLSNLPAGTYHLLAEDPAYPHCAATTAITVIDMGGVIIDTVKVTGTMCNEATGTAQVFMHDSTKSYEYSWDNSAFSSNSTISGIPPGSHTVLVRDIATGCTDQKPFQILTTVLQYSASSQNEVCHNAQGSITLTLPASVSDFNITWNGITGTDAVKTNLSAGTFIIHVQSASHPACAFDTTITITNIDKSQIIQSLAVQNSDCQTPTGLAQITTYPGSYTYSWDNGSYGSVTQMSNLAAGQHTISVKDNSSSCMADTVFQISADGLLANVTSRNVLCHADNGSISIISSANTEVIWKDGSNASFYRNNLTAGNYAFTVRDITNPSCKVDGSVTITDSVYTLSANFDYTILNPDSLGSKTVGFKNTSPNYLTSWTSFWKFGDGYTSHDVNPVHNYSQDLSYTIILQVVDSNGCSGEAKKTFSPFLQATSPCSNIALPNVFSPNNDGMNDDIGLLGNAPYVELKVFNRWGEVIFRTEDVSYRWNGKYRGEECPVDVYPYILDWECVEDNGNSKKHHKVGDITLVR